MSLRSVLTGLFRAVSARLFARVGAYPLRVAAGVAALGAGGYLYRAAEAARRGGQDLLPAIASTVAAHPAYALLAAVGAAALASLG